MQHSLSRTAGSASGTNTSPPRGVEVTSLLCSRMSMSTQSSLCCPSLAPASLAQRHLSEQSLDGMGAAQTQKRPTESGATSERLEWGTVRSPSVSRVSGRRGQRGQGRKARGPWRPATALQLGTRVHRLVTLRLTCPGKARQDDCEAQSLPTDQGGSSTPLKIHKKGALSKVVLPGDKRPLLSLLDSLGEMQA